MVGITVVLAAAIGAFVLDMGTTAEAAPQASLAVSLFADDDRLVLTHRGGDGLPSSRVRLLLTDGDGERLALGPSTELTVLTVGGSVEVDVAAANITTDTWRDMPRAEGSGFAVEPGDRLTATVIDTEAQRVVFEAAVDA